MARSLTDAFRASVSLWMEISVSVMSITGRLLITLSYALNTEKKPDSARHLQEHGILLLFAF